MPRLVLVDATSAAGGLRFDPGQVDVYYFAPAEGAGLRRRALARGLLPCGDRAHRAAGRRPSRWIPPFLDLRIALENSRLDQTYNTPALATVFLAVEQVRWILENGGLPWSAARCDRSAEIVY